GGIGGIRDGTSGLVTGPDRGRSGPVAAGGTGGGVDHVAVGGGVGAAPWDDPEAEGDAEPGSAPARAGGAPWTAPTRCRTSPTSCSRHHRWSPASTRAGARGSRNVAVPTS